MSGGLNAELTTPLRAPERDELLSAVARIAPVLSENSRQAEIDRTLPLASVEALRESRAYAMLAPREVGGLDVDPVTMVEVIEAVAHADPSAGWDVMVGSAGGELVGVHGTDQAVSEIFGGEVWPFMASTVKAGSARFERVDDGYRVSARWPFGSGILHSQYVMVVANGPTADGSGEMGVAMVIPTESLTIHDDWHVGGLQGSGSPNYEARDLFVPAYMTWDLPYVPRRGSVRAAFPQFLLCGLSAFALGVARRSLDEIIAQAKTKMRPGSKNAVAARPYFQHVLGEAEMEYRAMRNLRYSVLGEMWETVVRGGEVSGETWDYDNALNAYVARVCMKTTATAFSFGGSHSASLANPLQRGFRDMAVAGQHLQFSEQFFEAFGRSLLGIDHPDDGPPSYSRFNAAKTV